MQHEPDRIEIPKHIRLPMQIDWCNPEFPPGHPLRITSEWIWPTPRIIPPEEKE